MFNLNNQQNDVATRAYQSMYGAGSDLPVTESFSNTVSSSEMPKFSSIYQATEQVKQDVNQPSFSDPYKPYEVVNNDGSIYNPVTNQTSVDTTASPKQSQQRETELAEVLSSGDERSMMEFTNNYLSKLGDRGSQFDYQLRDEKDGWIPALTQVAMTGLVAAIAKKQGADDNQVGRMMASALVQGGQALKTNKERLGRQANIEALEAKGYLQEDILKWLDTGKNEDLIYNLKNRPHAEARTNKTSYYEAGDTLPDGSKAKKAGSYTSYFTYTAAGVPQVAAVNYEGDLEGKKLQQAKDIAEMQQNYKIQVAQQKEQAKTQAEQLKQQQQIASTNELLTAIDNALISGDEAGGDHTGWFDNMTPTIFADTQKAEGDFNRVMSLLTVDNLDKMKGVLTDRDVEILKQAATSLNQGYGWGVNKGELSRISDQLKERLSTGVSPQAKHEGVGATATNDYARGNDGNLYQFRDGAYYQVQE